MLSSFQCVRPRTTGLSTGHSTQTQEHHLCPALCWGLWRKLQHETVRATPTGSASLPNLWVLSLSTVILCGGGGAFPCLIYFPRVSTAPYPLTTDPTHLYRFSHLCLHRNTLPLLTFIPCPHFARKPQSSLGWALESVHQNLEQVLPAY
jgi:hypothetical protein